MREEYQLTLDDIFYKAINAKKELQEAALEAGHANIKLYLHWTAGWYDDHYTNHYHLSIDNEGKIYSACDSLAEVLPHTWKRNSGSIGITLACGANCTSSDLGDAPPTVKQIEMMARVVACLTDALNLPVNIQTVLTHGEAADLVDGDTASYGYNDAYGCNNGCERWDLQYLGTPDSPEYTSDYDDPAAGGNVIRGKAIWYRNYGYK